MTPVRVGPGAIFHRYHSPDWAHLPTSGSGAAVNGGRFNRPGIEALYLSAEPETALDEYRQDASISPPATLVAYHVDVAGVVDLARGYDPATWPATWPARWAEVGCDWKYLARVERRDPPTWRIADELIRDGAKGLLFPSFRRVGGTNLVLFNASLDRADRVDPHDPSGTLPRNQSSWR